MFSTRHWVYLFLTLLVLILILVIASKFFSTRTGSFYITETITSEGSKEPDEQHRYFVRGIKYTKGLRKGKTGVNGNFTYRTGTQVGFSIGDLYLPAVEASSDITQHSFQNIHAENLVALLLKLDDDGDKTNNIQITPDSFPDKALDLDLTLPPAEFKKQLFDNFIMKGQFQYTDLDKNKRPVYKLSYRTSVTSTNTDESGGYLYQPHETVNFHIGDILIGSTKADKDVSPDVFEEPISTNLRTYLRTMDEDNNPQNGIHISELAGEIKVDFTKPVDEFEQDFAKALNQHDKSPIAAYEPSLGINLEAPQAEADTVGQSVAFVDVFRTARPFKEFSDPEVTFDEQGWPINIPKGKQAHTLLLQSLPENAIPFGEYTVLYEGKGKLKYEGLGKLIKSSPGRDTVLIDKAHSTINRFIFRITETSKRNPIRNIRVVMPGGICKGNPFIRVVRNDQCKPGQFRTFVSMLKKDRNNIIFNPDYLRFLKDFKVLRMMNFMEASHRIPRSCYAFKDDKYRECLLQPLHWKQRPKLDDAAWGGSYRTDNSDKHGVPIEVVVQLANQLKAHPWINLPHNVTDGYVQNIADYIEEYLSPDLRIYLEYTNEAWNGMFWSAHYTRTLGRKANLDPGDQNPYREGFRYYARRAVEIFELWGEIFDDPDRTTRIAGSYIAAPDLSENILKFEDAHLFIDAIAVAPYFHACWDRKHIKCKNPLTVPIVLGDVENTDQIFKMFDNDSDPYSLPSVVDYIKRQAAVAKKYEVDLFAYEGGQHITVRWEDKSLSKEKKEKLKTLFRTANKDPRMAENYRRLLNAWKENDGKLFVMFTLPQTSHRWGSWGSKEHLNQPRAESPKYDAYMSFQESIRKCWWKDCEL